MKCTNNKFFVVKDAYYQSWVKTENEKGTNIIIKIAGIKNGVTFDSIIFRGCQLPLFTEEKDGIVTLTGILYKEIPEIAFKTKTVNKSDRLLYHFQGTEHFYELKNIRREKMKYY